jgi:hypothetical protein
VAWAVAEVGGMEKSAAMVSAGSRDVKADVTDVSDPTALLMVKPLKFHDNKHFLTDSVSMIAVITGKGHHAGHSTSAS